MRFPSKFSAAAIGTIRHPEPVPPVVRERPKIWREIVEGAWAVAGDRVQLATAASLITVEFGFQIIRPVYLLFTAKQLGFPPECWG